MKEPPFTQGPCPLHGGQAAKRVGKSKAKTIQFHISLKCINRVGVGMNGRLRQVNRDEGRIVTPPTTARNVMW